MRVVGRSSSPRTRWLHDWADAHGKSSVLDADETADAYLGKLGLTETDLPVAVLRSHGAVLRDPDDAAFVQRGLGRLSSEDRRAGDACEGLDEWS